MKSKEKRSKQLILSSFVLSIGTFLPKLASFIILPILTACLTKEEYGSYDLIVVLASLVLPAATLQIQTAAFRFLIDVRDEFIESKRIISNIFVVFLPISVCVLVIVYLVFPSKIVSLKLCICLYLFIDTVYNVLGQIARGLSNNNDYSIAAVINSVGNMLFILIFLSKLNKGLLGAIITLFLSYAIASLYLIGKIKIYKYIEPALFDVTIIKKMLAYSWPMVPNALSMWVMRASDRFVILSFMGTASNAVYAVANKIPAILTLAQNTFAMAWQENASISVNDENVGEYYSSMFLHIFDLMAGFMGLLIGLTPLLYRILIRGDYQEALNQIPILLLAMLFFGLSSFMGGIYVAFLRTKSVGITTAVGAIINITIDLLTIRYIGIYAASISTLVSYIALFIYRSIDVKKFVEFNVNHIRLLLVFTCLILECFLYYKNFPISHFINSLVGMTLLMGLNYRIFGQLTCRIMKSLSVRK